MTKIECIEEDGEKICADLPVDVASEEKIPHPEYDELSKLNKIALLRMARDDTQPYAHSGLCIALIRSMNISLTLGTTTRAETGVAFVGVFIPRSNVTQFYNLRCLLGIKPTISRLLMADNRPGPRPRTLTRTV
ncbi:serine protease [Culex quinquefasciatus]|uniref:Serine protease n=1 Tax=Culex quinquefasciatus TaxID=7176 RepID=B0X4S1_CULQU|nr:serine protease [Culex quinquefasciatus]|eukprot:XP_001864643.1 serine protease [Culex quinquefasciatus]